MDIYSGFTHDIEQDLHEYVTSHVSVSSNVLYHNMSSFCWENDDEPVDAMGYSKSRQTSIHMRRTCPQIIPIKSGKSSKFPFIRGFRSTKTCSNTICAHQ